MNETDRYTVYKITSQENRESYIFSIQPDKKEAIIYYLIRIDQDKKPTIERITNALGLLSNNNIIIQRLDGQKEELCHFASLIELAKKEIAKTTTTTGSYPKGIYTSQLRQEDLKLLKLN